MKFYIEGTIACDVHHEKGLIKNLINCANQEIVEYIDEADYIIITDSCVGSYTSFLEIINYLKLVDEYKKENAKVIVSGCLGKGINFELTEDQKTILDKTIIVHPDNISNYIADIVGYDKENRFGFDIPTTIEHYALLTSVVQGCLNNCAFCKKNYMNFDLKSVKLESVKYLVDAFNENQIPVYYGNLMSSNLSLYGVDLYNERKAHEVINLFSQIDSIKFINIGALINWYPELIKEILNNPKIKQVFTSIETGSQRLYELMNRPIELSKLIEIIKIIKKERPDIQIDTEFIAGFPTETIDDIKETINLVNELEVYPTIIHPYINSFCIPSSNLTQHSDEYIKYATKYIESNIQNTRNLIKNKIENGEKIVAHYFDDIDTYQVVLQNGSVKNINAKKLVRKYNCGEIIK